MGEHVRTGKHEKDRDTQLLHDRALRHGTRQGGCRRKRHEDREQDRVCHQTRGLSTGLLWGAIAAQATTACKHVIGNSCNTRIANEIRKRASWEPRELSG